MFKRGEGEDRDQPIHPMEVRVGNKSDEVTVVGRGARLEGTVVSAGSLRIDGQVKGKISADGDVVMTGQSQVDADIQANNVVVAGRFKGNIVAKNKAELSSGGRVEGNITSKVLVIAEGAAFSGQSVMDGVTPDGDALARGRGGTGERESQPQRVAAEPAGSS